MSMSMAHAALMPLAPLRHAHACHTLPVIVVAPMRWSFSLVPAGTFRCRLVSTAAGSSVVITEP